MTSGNDRVNRSRLKSLIMSNEKCVLMVHIPNLILIKSAHKKPGAFGVPCKLYILLVADAYLHSGTSNIKDL